MTEEQKIIREALLRDFNSLRQEELRLKKELGVIAIKRNIIRKKLKKIEGKCTVAFDYSAHAAQLYAINNCHVGEAHV